MLTEVTVNPRCCAMVAEDRPEISAAIRQLLEAHGYEVVGSVEDGARVLEEAARLRPDIILLDLNMPNMDGLDACRELARMLPQTRIIVVTAEGPIVEPATLAAGAFAFVEKEALYDALMPAIRLACDDIAARSSHAAH